MLGNVAIGVELKISKITYCKLMTHVLRKRQLETFSLQNDFFAV